MTDFGSNRAQCPRDAPASPNPPWSPSGSHSESRLCICVSVYLCIHVSVYLGICVSVYLCICVSVYRISVYLCICVSAYLCICVSEYRCIGVSVYLCICVSVCVFVSVCLCICVRVVVVVVMVMVRTGRHGLKTRTPYLGYGELALRRCPPHEASIRWKADVEATNWLIRFQISSDHPKSTRIRID